MNICRIFSVEKVLIFTSFIFLFPIFFQNNVKAATADSFVFTAVGDYGNNYNTDPTAATQTNFTKVIRGIGKQQPDFHLGLGDYTYNDTISNASKWCSSVRANLNVGAGKAVDDPWGLNFPFEIVAGNHDVGESNADIITATNAIRDCLPHKINNITESPTVKRGGNPATSYAIEYYFDYPNTTNPVARIILASPGLVYDNGGEIKYNKGTANYNFVKNAIIDARNKNIPWVIVGKHKNCITNGTKSCEYSTDFMDMMAGKDLGPNGGYGLPVDLVLEGHEHSYHRSKQLLTNATNCTTIQLKGYNANCVSNPGPFNFSKGAGKILSIIGTGGVSLRSISGSSDAESGYFTSWMGTNQAFTGGVSTGGTNSWGFTKFTVSRTNLTAQFISTTGSYSDNFTISTNGVTPNPTIIVTPSPIATPTPIVSKTPTPVPSTTKTPTPTGVVSTPTPTGPINNIVASEDTYTFGGSTTTNYGTDTTLDVKNGSGTSFDRITFLKFNVSGIKNVISAKLRLYVKALPNGPSAITVANEVNDDNWSETGLNFSNMPTIGAEISPVVTVGSTGSYIEYDVTSYINSEIAGNKVASIAIQNTTNLSVQFDSKEGTNKPVLVINSNSSTNRLDLNNDGRVDLLDIMELISVLFN